jgi:hypothetical protein
MQLEASKNAMQKKCKKVEKKCNFQRNSLLNPHIAFKKKPPAPA